MSVSDIVGSMLHPQEISAMVKLKFGGFVKKPSKEPLLALATKLDDREFCYAVLTRVSRSFAVVIQQLPECLRDVVCIFYLVLRGLDSVEDDMTYPVEKRVPLLRCFHEKCVEDGWQIENVGDSADYRILLSHFAKVIRVIKSLPKKYVEVILDITARMGAGMADFAERKSVNDLADYNLYCHYVAGLVGHGLSRLFAQSGLEGGALSDERGLHISNSMGLFLQKTNIIRDYLEDLNQGRIWWPKQVWSNYANSLEDFARKPNHPDSVACLNHLVTDALAHVPDVMAYLSMLKDPQIFRFCAIPQVMAIATLAECYNNTNVFKRVCKIRKGLSAKIMVDTSNMEAVFAYFNQFATTMLPRVPPAKDKLGVSAQTRTILLDVKKNTAAPLSRKVLTVTSVIAWLVLITATIFLFNRFKERQIETQLEGGAVRQSGDFLVVGLLIAAVVYIMGFFGLNLV